MEEAPENGKESSHSAHAIALNEWMKNMCTVIEYLHYEYYIKEANFSLQDQQIKSEFLVIL